MRHHLDGNMRAADDFHSALWRPEDFDACCLCGTEFADPDDNEEHDPHSTQSKDDPALCCWCADTLGDEE
ncbi:hypothetical protein [Paracoccus sp. AS002]|uniref:hypothetical protein n=1 Tax=Paracoccus sp. AS002 TaxID=3019545 RepID=UPI0023E7EA20|nr:hypothetical protein [Paracoccus sp. AS002]MDF3904660.1 hypothetical protein [Paracoccus sp. AS002]